MDKAETATILAMVSALDRQPVNDGNVEMWWRMLKDYSFELVESAIIPAYQNTKNTYITAKDVWTEVRRINSQPVPRAWVKELHDLGEHFECRPGEWGHPQAVTV